MPDNSDKDLQDRVDALKGKQTSEDELEKGLERLRKGNVEQEIIHAQRPLNLSGEPGSFKRRTEEVKAKKRLEELEKAGIEKAQLEAGLQEKYTLDALKAAPPAPTTPLNIDAHHEQPKKNPNPQTFIRAKPSVKAQAAASPQVAAHRDEPKAQTNTTGAKKSAPAPKAGWREIFLDVMKRNFPLIGSMLKIAPPKPENTEKTKSDKASLFTQVKDGAKFLLVQAVSWSFKKLFGGANDDKKQLTSGSEKPRKATPEAVQAPTTTEPANNNKKTVLTNAETKTWTKGNSDPDAMTGSVKIHKRPTNVVTEDSANTNRPNL